MSFLRLLIDRWFNNHFRSALEAAAGTDEFLQAEYNPEISAIYRIPLENKLQFNFDIDGEIVYTLKRGFRDLFGLGERAYLVDTSPYAQFGKSQGLYIFKGFSKKPKYSKTFSDPLVINEIVLPVNNPHFVKNQNILTTSIVNTSVYAQISSPTPIQATILAGPFPGTNLPTPPRGSTAPPITTGVTPPSGGTYLFYGLCFQYSSIGTIRGFGSWNFTYGPYNATDSLWNETVKMANAFKLAGYRSVTGVAGDHDPTKANKAEKFSDMMSGLATDLAAQTSYCQNANDQLVIFIAAHGYNSQSQSNPTNDIAIKYDSKSNKEWISHTQLFKALAAIPQIAANPQKVILIFESCRSGRAFEGGVVPKSLKSINILSATQTSHKLTNAGDFTGAIIRALGDGVQTWTDLIKRTKWRMANGGSVIKGFGLPGNGTIAGCHITVTLTSIDYNGQDIGEDWEFTFVVSTIQPSKKGNTNVKTNNDAKHDMPKHKLANGNSETPNHIFHEGFWGPCASTNIVKYRCVVTATEHDLLSDDKGSNQKSYDIVCNGSTFTKTLTASVTEGSKTADIDFNFEFKTECL